MDLEHLAVLGLCFILQSSAGYENGAVIQIIPADNPLWVKLGTSFTLTCNFHEPCPGVQYTWYKAESTDDNSRSRRNSMFTFPDLKISDEGLYRCEVTCGGKTEKSQVKLHVFSLGIPEITQSNLNGNDTINVTCHVSNVYPDGFVNVELYLGDKLLRNETLDTLDHMSVIHTLSLRREDQGKKFICIARRTDCNFSTEQSQKLNFSEAPSNVQIDVSAPLLEDQEVFMKCSSEGHPSPDISWNRINLPWPSNLQRHSNGTVTGLLSPENSGLYECIANNTMGQNRKPISLAVEYGPRYTSIHASETSIRTRELLNLTCVTDSYPAVQQYKWKKLPAQAVPKDVTQNNSYLIINSFQKHHEGIYECEVVHQRGRTERVYFNAILKEPEEQTRSQSSPLPGAVAGSLLVGMTGGGLAGFLLAKRLL